MGSAEIDGETLADIEKQGKMFFVHECHRLLKEGDYHPQPVKRQYIPKKDEDRAYKNGTSGVNVIPDQNVNRRTMDRRRRLRLPRHASPKDEGRNFRKPSILYDPTMAVPSELGKS